MVSRSETVGAIVNVFDLDRALVRDYERFARSFTPIRAAEPVPTKPQRLRSLAGVHTFPS
jgi:hypothetical protein